MRGGRVELPRVGQHANGFSCTDRIFDQSDEQRSSTGVDPFDTSEGSVEAFE
jgi:hypothetical protein